jgi:hypothetical protein
MMAMEDGSGGLPRRRVGVLVALALLVYAADVISKVIVVATLTKNVPVQVVRLAAAAGLPPQSRGRLLARRGRVHGRVHADRGGRHRRHPADGPHPGQRPLEPSRWACCSAGRSAA